MSTVTIRCRLATSEETRRHLWQLMVEKNTPLINALLKLVAQHADFGVWRRRGTLPDKAVEQLCAPLKQNPRFAEQPGRFYTSAQRTVQQTYEAWLAFHHGKQAQLEGKKRWLKTIESDTQLAEVCHVSLEGICAKASAILEQLSTSVPSGTPPLKQLKKSKKSKKPQKDPSLLSQLFELFDTTEDPLSRRAIIHLLKHGCKVNEQEENLGDEDLSRRLARKRKEIQRLEEQLKAQTPKGRAPTDEEAEERILQAISLPEHPGLMFALYLAWALFYDPVPSPKYTQFVFTCLLRRVCQFEEARIYFEFLDWKEDFAYNGLSLMRSPKSLPYPILYGAGDLRWSRNQEGRICVSFNGLGQYSFQVYCDKRQLSLFELFLQDSQTLKAKENQNQYTGSFLLLRDASLLWQEKEQGKRVVQKIKSQINHPVEEASNQQAQEQNSAPWNQYRLELQCTIDTQHLTIEGTEQIRQTKLASRSKELKDRRAKNNLDETQLKALHREESKQTRLENAKHFRRSDAPLYKGDPDVLVGVSFNLAAPATVAVVKGSTGEVLAFRSPRQLLGNNYKLLNRQRHQQQQHDQQRRRNQQRGKAEQPSESELGLYIDRLLAKAIITLAKQYQANSVVLPEMKGLRERIQSELEAKAERKIPGSKAAQALYAKQYRQQVHRWSYGRLMQNVQSQAAKVGIRVESGYQPFEGNPQEKARDLAIAAYHARQISS